MAYAPPNHAIPDELQYGVRRMSSAFHTHRPPAPRHRKLTIEIDKAMDKPNPKLAIIVNDARFFLSHRLPIGVAALEAGFDVTIWCPDHPACQAIRDAGLTHRPTRIHRGNAGPLREMTSFASLAAALVLNGPRIVHLVTSKPVIYGGLLARLARIPTVAAISGLGHIFTDHSNGSLLRSLVISLYRFALAHRRAVVIFQNGDDQRMFERHQISKSGESIIINGSGTDLSCFNATPSGNVTPRFILPSRMLIEKGVSEFVAAAGIVRSAGYDAEFILIGDPDFGNPTSIDWGQLEQWAAEGVIAWRPHTTAIADELFASDVVVLPSYREGLPKTLIDAAAAGRAVITTNVPGCRDAIIAEETGLLCEPRDPAGLAEKMITMIENPDRRIEMGQAGRRWAEQRFDVRLVIERHLEIYRHLLELA